MPTSFGRHDGRVSKQRIRSACEDVATVVDSVEDERTAAWIYQEGEKQRTVLLVVMRQPNSNVVETNRRRPAAVAADRESASAGGQAQHSRRPSKTIREAFEDVQFTMSLTIAW